MELDVRRVKFRAALQEREDRRRTHRERPRPRESELQPHPDHPVDRIQPLVQGRGSNSIGFVELQVILKPLADSRGIQFRSDPEPCDFIRWPDS